MDRREARAEIEDQQLEEREKRCSGKVREVERREGEVKAKEDRWAEMESVMKDNAVKLPTVIKLNVSMLLLSTPTLLPTLLLSSFPFTSSQISLLTLTSLLHPFLLSLFSSSKGGTKFSVSKEKLLQHKGSLFEMLLSSSAKYVITLSILPTLPFTYHFLIFKTGYFWREIRSTSNTSSITCCVVPSSPSPTITREG